MYPNHRSTWLSQLEYVGVLCMWNLGCLVSILVRNFRNSVARCRRWVEVVTLPFEVSNAANNVVVPDGEMDPVLGCGALSGASSGSSANLGLATGGTPIVEVSGLIGPYASGTGRGRRIRPCRRTANRTSAARYLAVAALIGVVPQGIGLRDTKRKALPSLSFLAMKIIFGVCAGGTWFSGGSVVLPNWGFSGSARTGGCGRGRRELIGCRSSR